MFCSVRPRARRAPAGSMDSGNVLRPLSRELIGGWVVVGLSDTLGQDAERLGTRPIPYPSQQPNLMTTPPFGPDHDQTSPLAARPRRHVLRSSASFSPLAVGLRRAANSQKWRRSHSAVQALASGLPAALSLQLENDDSTSHRTLGLCRSQAKGLVSGPLSVEQNRLQSFNRCHLLVVPAPVCQLDSGRRPSAPILS